MVSDGGGFDGDGYDPMRGYNGENSAGAVGIGVMAIAGAAIGAIGGGIFAFAGDSTHNYGKDMLIGAAIGGPCGSIVGALLNGFVNRPRR